MNVLTLGKYDLTKSAALANTGYFGTGARERIILGKHINASALLNGAAKRNAKRGRGSRHSLGKYVYSLFKRSYRIFGVLMEIITQHNGVDARIEHLVKILVAGDLVSKVAKSLLYTLSALIADSRYLKLLKAVEYRNKGSSAPRAENAYLKLF
jgi:hypothetical protein